MNYFEHAALNLRVSARCIIMAVFHAAHAILPVRCTSHEYWGIK